MIFNVDNAGQIAFVNKLEEDKKAETSSKFSAKALFQTRDKMGVSDVADTVLNTTHQNQVRIILLLTASILAKAVLRVGKLFLFAGFDRFIWWAWLLV